MNSSRIALIVLIYISVSIAWMVLGTTITSRTTSAREQLRGDVEAMWGTPLKQTTPQMALRRIRTEREIERGVPEPKPQTVVPDSNELSVDLDLDLRRRGLIWFRTYEVEVVLLRLLFPRLHRPDHHDRLHRDAGSADARHRPSGPEHEVRAGGGGGAAGARQCR